MNFDINTSENRTENWRPVDKLGDPCDKDKVPGGRRFSMYSKFHV